MRILCVIPVRGGSKGIPRKNLREIAGKPLVAWTILQALAARDELEGEHELRVVVSTDDQELSAIARLGSGSAARSLWHGFVKWERGTRDDGSDSIAAPITSDWQELRIALVEIDSGAKKTASGAGMNHTTATSPLYAAWPETAAADLATIEAAIHARDFSALGNVAEANALAMHATMLAARPALCYLQPQTLATLHRLWQARADGLDIYATIDAGPNVKILCRARDETAVRDAFPQALWVNPFAL